MDDVESRLSAALRQGASNGVHVGAVIEGSRVAVPERRRRNGVIAAVLGTAVLAGAGTGVALQLTDGDPTLVAGTTSTASAPPSVASSASPLVVAPSASPSVSPSASAKPSVVASASPVVALPRTRQGLVIIPDGALLGPDDLAELPGVVLVTGFDSQQYLKVPTTSTSSCAKEPLGLQYAVGGRSILRLQREDNSDQWSLSSAVRVFGQNGSKDQIRWLQRNLDTCTGVWGDLTTVDVAGIGDGAAMAYSTTVTPHTVMVLGAVRSGRATSGFQLFVPVEAAGSDEERVELAVAQGTRLLEVAHQHLVDTIGPASLSDRSLR